VISLPLWAWNDEGATMRSRVRRGLESWDTGFVSGVGPSTIGRQGRVSSRGGAWNVVYCSTDSDSNHDGEFCIFVI
jgi:ribonuclease P/MRP protein subunit RPP40